MKKKYTLRKFFTDVHLWLGIGSGLVLFVVCLSGTVYTFRTEIERLANPSKYYSASDAGSPKIPVDVLVARLEKQFNGKVTSLLVPADPAMNYQVGIKPAEQKGKAAGRNNAGARGEGRPESTPGKSMKKEPGTGGEGKGEKAEARPTTYFVDPHTGLVAGDQSGGTAKFFTMVMQLHRWLLIDNATGTLIVGIATLIFVFIIGSGLVIWFPRRIKNWKQGLTIKFGASWKRINHDLHNTLGFYSFILLLIMALTGLCWSFEWYRDGVGKVLGAKVFRGRGEKPLQSARVADSTAVIPAGAHMASANALFAYNGDVRVSFPADAAGAVTVTKNKTGFFAFSGADKVQFDRFTGKPLKVERFSGKRFSEKIADSVKPLHTGEIYGLFSKILYFIACLFATSLPVTGTIIWINKLKKKQSRKLPAEKAGRANGIPENSYEAEIGI